MKARMMMKNYEGQFYIFHGVGSGFPVNYNDYVLLERSFKNDDFKNACVDFYLSALQTASKYIPQTNGELVSFLFDFREKNQGENLIYLMSDLLEGITRQPPTIRRYSNQGILDSGIVVKIKLHEKLLLGKNSLDYVFFH